MRIVLQIIKRITNKILGVKGLIELTFISSELTHNIILQFCYVESSVAALC